VTLSILYIGCHSVFFDDFKFDRDFVFADDLCISYDIAFLTIPCVSHDFIFSIDFMCRSWINWLCWLHMSALTQYSLMISRSIVTVFTADLWISRDIAFLTIPCIGHDSIFAIDWMCRSWINWRCRLNTSAVTQHSIKISRSTVTLFSPPICGSALT
jgi:hypothetical protein